MVLSALRPKIAVSGRITSDPSAKLINLGRKSFSVM
jgi:hypothetical protein